MSVEPGNRPPYSTDNPGNETGGLKTELGNNVERIEDTDDTQLIAKLKAVGDSELAQRAALYTDHGDIGKVGSYRIDGSKSAQ